MFLGDKNWKWFKIYVFTKEDIDLAKELETLNLLLVKHGLEAMENFVCVLNICCCLIEVLLLCQKRQTLKNKMSIEFDLFVAFWRTVDENGSIM